MKSSFNQILTLDKKKRDRERVRIGVNVTNINFDQFVSNPSTNHVEEVLTMVSIKEDPCFHQISISNPSPNLSSVINLMKDLQKLTSNPFTNWYPIKEECDFH